MNVGTEFLYMLVERRVPMIAKVHYRDVLILRLNELPTEPIMVEAHSKHLKTNYLFVFDGRKSRFCSVDKEGNRILKRTNERHLHRVFCMLKSNPFFKFFSQTPPLLFTEKFDLYKSGVILANNEVKETMIEWFNAKDNLGVLDE